MNIKTFGLVFGILGVLLLLVAAIIGIVIGVNDRTIQVVGNKDDPSEADGDDVENAYKTNAFLRDFNNGLAAWGMGLLMIGVGMAIAKDSKGNTGVLIVGLVAGFIIFISFSMALYQGIITRQEVDIYLKDDRSDSDGDTLADINENQAFLAPTNNFCGGFIYGSFGIALALFTIVLGAFVSQGGKKKVDFSLESTLAASTQSSSSTAEDLYGKDYAATNTYEEPTSAYPPPASHGVSSPDERGKYPPPPY